MSFGSSPGDIIIVLSLAKQLYRNCKASKGEYLEVAREVGALHTVLRHLKYEILDSESLLNRDRSKYSAQLIPIIGNCEYTLRQLDELLRKYGKLADDKPGIWERIRFGSSEMDNLGDIRMKLNNHKTTITVFLDTVQLHHGARVSQALDGQTGQLEVILDKVDKIAERMGQRAQSMLTSYGNDDKEVWKEFRRELVAEGFSSDVLQRHKDVLRAYIREIDQKGLLSEIPPTPTSASNSVSTDWLESVAEAQSPFTGVKQNTQSEDMKEVVVREENMKFPQSIKAGRGRGRPDFQDTPRDMQHAISALTINTKEDNHRVRPAPVLSLQAPKTSSPDLEGDSSSSDESHTSSKVIIMRTSDLTNSDSGNFPENGNRFLRAPQARRPAQLQLQLKAVQYSRSNSPVSINSQASDESRPRSRHDVRQTAESPKSYSAIGGRSELVAIPTRRNILDEEHSRSPQSSSTSLAPDSRGNNIPDDAKWTKIRRSLVSLEILDQDGHRYEARPEFVAVLGVLSRREIEKLALRSKAVREARRPRSREDPSQSLSRKAPQNFRYTRSPKKSGYKSTSDEDSDFSSEPERHRRRNKGRHKRSSRSHVNNEQSPIPYPNPTFGSAPNLQAAWSPTSQPPAPGWSPSQVYPYPYAPPQMSTQPMQGYYPSPSSHPPMNPSVENRKHRSRRHGSSDRHQSQGRDGKRDNGSRWRENLTAVGIGGAAVSLLSVLSEAAGEF